MYYFVCLFVFVIVVVAAVLFLVCGKSLDKVKWFHGGHISMIIHVPHRRKQFV